MSDAHKDNLNQADNAAIGTEINGLQAQTAAAQDDGYSQQEVNAEPASEPVTNRYQAASKVKPEYNMGRQILITSLKTILICVFAVFVSVLCVYIVNPGLMANICGNLGFKNAEISCLELVYTRNKTDVNLYNLILKLGSNGSKQNDYIAKLQASNSYQEFCDNIDASTVAAYKSGSLSKRYLCYTYGADEYLNSRVVLNLLGQNKWEEAYAKATANMTTEQDYSCVVYYFAEYLLTSNVTAEQRVEYFTKLLNSSDFSALQARLEGLEAADLTDEAKILNAYVQVKLSYTIYAAYTFGGGTDIKIADSKDTYEQAYTAWQQLVKN